MENRYIKRQKRVRSRMHGTKNMPRLSVHRSNVFISAQLIDDDKQITIFGVSEQMLPDKKGTKSDKAKALGMLLAKKALEAKIKTVVFDRGAYRYHGRVKSFAEGVREGGLQF